MINIRNAELDDALAISEMHAQMEEGIWPWKRITTCAVHLNRMLIEEMSVIVAEMGGKVVGHLDLIVGHEPAPWYRNAHIFGLFVDVDNRGRGVGRKLMENCIEWAKIHHCRTLTVMPAKEAEGFYAKFNLKFFLRQHLVKFNVAAARELCIYKVHVPSAHLANPCAEKQMPISRHQCACYNWILYPYSSFADAYLQYKPFDLVFEIDGEEVIARFALVQEGSLDIRAWANDVPLTTLINVFAAEAAKRGFQELWCQLDENHINGVLRSYEPEKFDELSFWLHEF